MDVNYLNGVSKKRPNWTKLTKIRAYTKIKIRIDLTKLDENWDQKGILTICKLSINITTYTPRIQDKEREKISEPTQPQCFIAFFIKESIYEFNKP